MSAHAHTPDHPDRRRSAPVAPLDELVADVAFVVMLFSAVTVVATILALLLII